jgi:acyl-CoA reductase-like NAD-dependent aldehyde dehydrogenase
VYKGEENFENRSEEMSQGNFFPVHVIENIPVDSPGYLEEFFGPVFSLF